MQDMNQLLHFKNMCKEELWMECANNLTEIIQNIIEFAKLIPGFMRLGQDDQVSHSLKINVLFFISSRTKVFIFRYKKKVEPS